MGKQKICAVTGTRAEYGVLYWLLKKIQNEPTMQLQLIVTGMHLSPEFGLTYKTIEEDGFEINARVEMLLSSDTAVGIAKSIGLGVIGFAEALERLEPDILLLMGDRFEMLAAAQTAMIAKIPIAHLGGGDVTEGSYDEAIRHSITKMSQIHIVSNEIAAQRVKQLGEDPALIFTVGGLGLEAIRNTKLSTREELEKTIGFKFRPVNLLITFHPPTLDMQPATKQFQELLDALDLLGQDVGLIFTKPNADNEGRALIKMIDDYAESRPNAKSYVSLGQQLYLSTVAQVNAVIGNSSSGLYEVPSLKKPTVNVGTRQKGRLQAPSVINAEPTKDSIISAIREALNKDCAQIVNPYGDGDSSDRIVTILKTITEPKSLLKKQFFDMNPEKE
jgi:UDP-hydrolysing UDP-N-acetyl-D-glucosamine 2-epimerase